MSSNQPHITRANYEEFFLLYIDNELSAEERRAVEAFTILHPDLGDELHLLQDTKLDADVFVFETKNALMADEMQASLIDESLLLYLDNELPKTQKAAVEERLQMDASFAEQYRLLLQTRLDKTERIIYPFKKDLYRTEEKSVRPFLWLRIAAAVLFVIGVGGFLVNQQDNIGMGGAVAHTHNSKLPVKPSLKEEGNNAQPVAIHPDVKTQPVLSKEDNASVSMQKTVYTVASNTKKVVSAVNSYSEPETTEVVNILPQRNLSIAERGAQQNNTIPAVTIETPLSYNSIAAADVAADIADEHNKGKQGSVRGLLRKATRFIERRTGVDPVNDDDQLVIGVVAISLK